jgi:hypothetical protein
MSSALEELIVYIESNVSEQEAKDKVRKWSSRQTIAGNEIRVWTV